MNAQAKDVALRFAEVVEEVALRLRLPDPAPEVIEAAAQDLEQMGRDLRRRRERVRRRPRLDRAVTRPEFQDWVAMSRDIFAQEGPVATGTRAFAEAVRPHDAALADLYIDVAKANEALRKHLARPR